MEKLVYNNLDWVASNRIDNYVTLNNRQQQFLEQRLDAVLVWHRTQELSRYQTQLKGLEKLQASAVSQKLVDNQINQIREHQQRLLTRIAAELFTLSQTLTLAQKQEILKNIKEVQQEINRKQLKKSQSELQEAAYEKIAKVSEWFIGPLSKKQEQRIRKTTNQLTPPAQEWQAHNDKVYQEWQKLFQLNSRSKEYRTQFMTLFLNSNTLYGNALSDKVHRDFGLTADLMTDVASFMSPRQWQYFHKQIADWQGILNNLRS